MHFETRKRIIRLIGGLGGQEVLGDRIPAGQEALGDRMEASVHDVRDHLIGYMDDRLPPSRGE